VDATGHRVDELSEQYRRVTGEATDTTDPDKIFSELTDWLRENESEVKTLLDDGKATFDGVSFEGLRSVFEVAWSDDQITEGELVGSSARQQAEDYEKVRDLLDGEPSPWSELQAAHDDLQANHSDSPTTESVATVLDASRPPSFQRVQQLIEEAKDPRTGGGAWAELQRVAEELRQELPNANITDDVTELVDADDRPTDEQATGLLDEAEELLARIREVRDTLDDIDKGGIVLIESQNSE